MNAFRLLLFFAAFLSAFSIAVPAPDADTTDQNLMRASDGGVPALLGDSAKTAITDDLSKCRVMTAAVDKAACLRRMGATDDELLPFQKCKLLSDDAGREKCIAGLRANVLESLPEIKLRACAAILDDDARDKCKSAVAKPAASLEKICEKFTDAEDLKQCRTALAEGMEEGVALRETAYACVEKFGNDMEGKLECLRKLRNEVKEIKLDCSVYSDSDLKGRCEVCSTIADPEKRSACVNRMKECREEYEGKDKDGLKACIIDLKDDDERENRCKNIEDANLKAACLKEQFGLKGIKACDTKAGEEKTNCIDEEKKKTAEFVKMEFRNMQNLIDKLEANGYLTEEEIAAIKEYVASKKLEFENAKTPEEKRAIIKEVLLKWEQFRNNKLLENHLKEIKKRVEIISSRIAKIKTISAELKTAGKDTAKLDAAITKVEQKVEEVKAAKTFKEAQLKLKNLQIYLAHLMKVIAYIREGKAIDIPDPTDIPVPSPTANSSAVPSPEGSPTPTPTPTPALNESAEPAA